MPQKKYDFSELKNRIQTSANHPSANLSVKRIKAQQHRIPLVIFVGIFIGKNGIRRTNINGTAGTVGNRTEMCIAVIAGSVDNVHFAHAAVFVEESADFNNHVLNSHRPGIKVPTGAQTSGTRVEFRH